MRVVTGVRSIPVSALLLAISLTSISRAADAPDPSGPDRDPRNWPTVNRLIVDRYQLAGRVITLRVHARKTDYFNCAYGYGLGTVATPTHGCLDLNVRPGKCRRESAYRFHLLDSVPFRTRFLMVQEAGCPRKGALRGDTGVNARDQLWYQWTCYWYQAIPQSIADRA